MPDFPVVSRSIAGPPGYHLRRTMSGARMGFHDPGFELANGELGWATRTPDGSASIRVFERDAKFEIRAWGDGASWIASRAESFLGFEDRPDEFRPADRLMRSLRLRHAGMHLPRLPRVFDRVVQVILLQLVPWREAVEAWCRLVRNLGEPAPGPGDLWLPPSPAKLRATPGHVFVGHGVLHRQARTVHRVARLAERIETAADRGPAAFGDFLGAIPGIGPWTVQNMRGSALGDADAVLVGDYNLPNTVAWVMRHEERGDDTSMLESLEPYRGNRYRVIRLIWASGRQAPRRGPRRPLRSWRLSRPPASI